MATIAEWLARFRAWRSRSISNQITVVAVSLALAVASVIGAATFVAVRALVRQNIAAALETRARLAEQKLLIDLGLVARELDDLADNSFVANGLIDSLGRDSYLVPFLREHRLPTNAVTGVVLCDFQGKPIASNLAAPPVLAGAMRGPRDVLATGEPHAELVNDPAGVQLLLSHPVVFPPTGQTEGVIVLLVDLARLLQDATTHLGEESFALLTANGMRVGPDPTGGARFEGATRRLALPGALASMELVLSVGDRGEPLAPLRWVAIAYVLIGIATVLTVFVTSRAMALRLAAPIEELSRAASRVQTGGEIGLAGADRRSDEVGTLAAALAAMVGKLRASHDALEERVRERTAELQGRERELARYAQTQAVLLREVNHRVKNNLAAIIGLLHLEEARAAGRTGAAMAEVLAEMESRIRSIATVHALLSSVEWRPLPLADLCERILRSSLGEGSGPAVAVEGASGRVLVESGQAHNLALVLNELATNTLKHGRGPVRVGIAREGGEVLLTYRDAGPGFPPEILSLAPERIGTGLQLIRGIVESSLGGRLELANDGGAVARIEFAVGDLDGGAGE